MMTKRNGYQLLCSVSTICLILLEINVVNFRNSLGIDAFSITTLHRAQPKKLSGLESTTSPVENVPRTNGATSPRERAEIARNTWETVGFAKTPDFVDERILFDDASRVTVSNKELFDEFKLLKGTYFINGLSSCRIGDRVIHPFEAHGFVKSLTFDGEGKSLHLKSAIVETPLTKLERIFNKALARGVMSTLGSPVWNALTSSERNTANFSTTLWPLPGSSSKHPSILIVAGDNGMPYVVDPKTLRTVGPISKYLPDLNDKKMLAHTRIDEERQRLILCGSSFDIRGPNEPVSTVIEFYEYDENLTLLSQRSYRSDRFMFVHDWMITNNYYIIPKNPGTFKWDVLPRFVLGLESGTAMFEMDESASGHFVLIPRHNPDLPPLHCPGNNHFTTFHFGPCFENVNNKKAVSVGMMNEDVDSSITIYASVFDRYQFGGEMGYNRGDSLKNKGMDPIGWSASGEVSAPRLDKFVFDDRRQILLDHERIPIVDDAVDKMTKGTVANVPVDVPVDMPTFNGDGVECRYSYFLGAARPEGWFPWRSVVKTDLQLKKSWNWDAGDDKIPSEPMFLPKQFHDVNNKKNKSTTDANDNGFVVSIVHDSTKKLCELVVWDSKTFGNGPIAVMSLGTLTPWNVHGAWVPSYVADEQEYR
ncbi:MAG: carotenoid oxygenase family protein [Burkholderiales bacterium]